MRRERLCVAVKAGRQGDLPKGSLNLATSGTGSTFYMDPAPTVPLNNAEALLAGEEAAEEARVLAALSGAVAERAGRIRQVQCGACMRLHAALGIAIQSLKRVEIIRGHSVARQLACGVQHRCNLQCGLQCGECEWTLPGLTPS